MIYSDDHRRRGVLLNTKCDLHAVVFEPKSAFPEQIWCRIPDMTAHSLLVGVCYRTPNPKIYSVNLHELLRQLMIELSQYHVLLMGDFNYGDIDWSCSTKEPTFEDSKSFLSCLNDCFLTQHVTESTRARSKATLDLVITGEPDMIDKVSVMEQFGSSDHHLLSWTTVIHSSVESITARKVKDYSKADFDSIRNMLTVIDWVEVLSGDMEHAWSTFKLCLFVCLCGV